MTRTEIMNPLPNQNAFVHLLLGSLASTGTGNFNSHLTGVCLKLS
jgi:hypothetical protein